MIKISQGVQFVVDGNRVLAKRQGTLCSLAGPDVQQILIPLLPELELGFNIEESSVLKNFDVQKTQKILGQLLGAKYLTLCDETEHVENNNKSPESSSYAPSLGVLGSEKLYQELIATFTSAFPTCIVRSLDAAHLQEATECDIVIYVNHGIDDSTTLSLADCMYNMHINIVNVSVDENNVKAGPYITQDTGCLRCYNSRRLSNLTYAYEARLFSTADKIFEDQEPTELSQIEVKFLAGILTEQCQQIVNTPSMFQSPLQERIITFNLSTLQITTEEFYRNPRCYTCGHGNEVSTEVKQWSVNPFLKED
ncbi:hypothetical protein GCM10007377_12710 [Galliscardovia ingluviei]|uniref:Bacteriocin biosynthesis cyclodehydratase domain-containing protein n=1 Tax=Galliscardovia ingluviei TaxID=1769422 RepID=A0A8J3F2R9_9BIFI|nr:TOMM precursor leader peptide-binding protein [Galliscardovia ingluviei]GGI14796.1 hypothetical protein GCM10007377_12710 [Galliscardovia ingluviei]